MFNDGPHHTHQRLLLGAVGARIVPLDAGDAEIIISEYSFRLHAIERALNSQPAIAECALVLRDIAGSTSLACYIMLAARRSMTHSEAQTLLSSQMPGFVLAWEIVFLTSMPHQGDGSIDREALAKRPRERRSYPTQYIAPRSAMEARLADAAANILQIDRLGIYDNFFLIGGILPLAEKFIDIVSALYPDEYERVEDELNTTSLFVSFCLCANIAYLVELLDTRHSLVVSAQQKPSILRVFSLRKGTH
jgi:uncharacterized membrane protein (GlpM family)